MNCSFITSRPEVASEEYEHAVGLLRDSVYVFLPR